MLRMRHPAFYGLSCDDCAKWMHTDGVVSRRHGLPVARPQGTVLPCFKCPKLAHTADKRREEAQEPTERSRRIIRHYLECKAVGAFPDDPLVRWHAGMIRDAEESLGSSRLDGLMEMGLLVLKRMAEGG